MRIKKLVHRNNMRFNSRNEICQNSHKKNSRIEERDEIQWVKLVNKK